VCNGDVYVIGINRVGVDCCYAVLQVAVDSQVVLDSHVAYRADSAITLIIIIIILSIMVKT